MTQLQIIFPSSFTPSTNGFCIEKWEKLDTYHHIVTKWKLKTYPTLMGIIAHSFILLCFAFCWEEIILRVQFTFLAAFQTISKKWMSKKILFLFFDHFYKSAYAFTNYFLETVKKNCKKVYIQIYENNVSEKNCL